eukprot:TRINITY_DN2401_c0_g1_i3.p1 TRINITY_DN2401_c0_g1~~TRINITY_DN2401_c0_g1_i3.p1  ORF type:complete len:663 (-),score=188.62 TRINITY_DN2401_c0_g1_i3:40-2028(-)
MNEFDPSMPIDVIFAGAFLTQASRNELLKVFPPKFNNLYCDHVTIHFAPDNNTTKRFPVGEELEITINGTYSDTKLQCVRVDISDQFYHITISTLEGVKPVECSHIKEEQYTKLENPIRLKANYGLLVTYKNDPLITLAKKTREKILNFVESAQPGESLKFKTEELSSSERSVVHEFAKQNGLKSESSGKKEQRKLTLTMIKKKIDYGNDNQQNLLKIYEHPEGDAKEEENKNKTFKIKDSSLYKALNLEGARKVNISGRVTEDSGIEWSIHSKSIEKNFQKNSMIIMRGLPGSGKSHVTKYLCEKYGHEICSADSYFTNKGGYTFDKDSLPEAHQFCYENSIKNVENGNSLIIDNTNSRKSEYNKYVRLAAKHEFHVTILEIYCCDLERAKFFMKRSLHDVPIKNIMMMEARWETDDESVLLEPYLDQFSDLDVNQNKNQLVTSNTVRLQQYLTTHKFFHNSKKRTKTHLFMAAGDNSSIYVDIPPKFKEEFYKIYYECDEPKYFSEMIVDKFRMYFDIDFKDKEVDNSLLISIAETMREHCNSKVYVTGCTANGKCGYHYHCYDTIVEYDKALEIRIEIIKLLNKKYPERNWDTIIDDAVYKFGIRMYGSRKVTKTVDMGRLYQVYYLIEQDGSVIENPIEKLYELKDAWKIQEQVSIHI